LGTKYFGHHFSVTSKKINVNQAFQIIDINLVKNVAHSTVKKFRIVSLASGGLSMGQIALWKPFQFFLLGIFPSVVHFSVFNILQ
jgi:hypothetical protein